MGGIRLGLGSGIGIGGRGGIDLSANSPFWYGVRIVDTDTSPDVERIAGSPSHMDYHASLPTIKTKGCLLLDTGIVNAYLPATNWSDGDTNGDGGQVLSEIGGYYRKVVEISATVHEIRHSPYPITGYEYIPPFYDGSYEAALNRSTLKLASVKNNTVTYRGGNNNAAWDAADNSLLGRPATNISLTNFRTYARNRGGVRWNVETYRLGMLLYEMFMIEYATKNSQKAVNATLTSEGYKQGGLGVGVSTAISAEWNAFSGSNPFVACGASNELGNGSGEVLVTVNNFGGAGVNRTFAVPRYRGIEHPFGHIFKWQDGCSVFHEAAGGASKLYVCNTPANFADGTETNYSHVGNLPTTGGYVKKMAFESNSIMHPSEVGGVSSTYYCDYYYTPGLINAWRALVRGRAADGGAGAGFGFLGLDYAASSAAAYFGSRLAYIP